MLVQSAALAGLVVAVPFVYHVTTRVEMDLEPAG